MSCSPTGATIADLTLWVDTSAAVPDPRARRGVRHALPQLLALGAVLAGARSFATMGQWT